MGGSSAGAAIVFALFFLPGYCTLAGEFAAPPYVAFIERHAARIVRHAPEKVRFERVEVRPTAPDGAAVPGIAVPTATAANHLIEVRGLAPGTEYRFTLEERAGGGERRSWEGRFRTAPAPGGSRPVRAALLGDGGKTTGGAFWRGEGKQGTIAARIHDWRPDLILYAGDVVYEQGEYDEYEEGFFRPFRDVLKAGIPIFPALGDHDIKTRHAEPFFLAFAIPGGAHYYSIDWGDLHVAVLDSASRRLDRDPAQLEWLERDLAASAAPWKVVLLHHPCYDQDGLTRAGAALAPVLARARPAAVLAGHEHLYERVGPVDGVLHLTSGGGGRSLSEPRESPGSRKIAARYHYVRLTFEPAALVVEAVDEQGQVFDRFVFPKPE